MNKQERLENTIAGAPTDRVPVALWRHWPGDDQRTADLAYSTIAYQQQYDWDLVIVTPADSFCVTDYGVQDEWIGSPEGTRSYTRRAVERSIQWTDLRPLDPDRGALGRQIETVRLITDVVNHWEDPPPIIQTIFSPLAQAEKIAGHDTLIRHLRTRPDRLHTGLNTLTESTLRFIDAIRRLPTSGIFYIVRHAHYDALSETEYKEFGLPYDYKILDGLIERWWLNILHLAGETPMFRIMSQLPVQGINWQDCYDAPTLEQAKTMFDGVVCGGLSSQQHLHRGTPAVVRDIAKQAMTSTRNHRHILSSGSAGLITSPLSNIRAARQIVEEVQVL